MQKNHMCKILAFGIIVLFIGVGIHPVFAIHIKHDISISNNVENCNIDKSGIKFSGGSELIVLSSFKLENSYQEYGYNICFYIKNVGDEIYDGYISTHGEIRRFIKPWKVVYEVTKPFKHVTINPGDKILYGCLNVENSLFIGLCFIWYDINPWQGDDTPYGNKITDIALVLFGYYPLYHFYR